MLEGRDHQVAARFARGESGAFDRQVVALGSARREDDLVAVRAEPVGDLVARVLDGFMGGAAQRVREVLVAQLASGSIEMVDVARKLGMSVATLRRKLDDEGSSFSAVLDELRRELALRYSRQPEPSVSEIAFLLGFSDLRAFGRAFKRWHGAAPTEFRDRELGR